MLLISSSFLVILISVTPPSYVSPHSVVVLQHEGPLPGDSLADLPWPSLLLVSTLPRSWFFEQSLSLFFFFMPVCTVGKYLPHCIFSCLIYVFTFAKDCRMLECRDHEPSADPVCLNTWTDARTSVPKSVSPKPLHWKSFQAIWR